MVWSSFMIDNDKLCLNSVRGATVELDKELKDQLKIQAIREGLSLKELSEKIVKDYLKTCEGD